MSRALLVAFTSAALGAAQELPSDRTDALNVLQGTSSDGPLDAACVERLADWIGRIRKAHPAVAEIHALPRHELGVAVLFFDDDAARIMERTKLALESGRMMVVGDTGIPALDELNRALGARLHYQGIPRVGGLWFARFAEDLDVPAVCRRYRELAALETAEPNGYGGDGDDILLKVRGDKLLLVFKRGWGDCMAGCIHNHYRYFEVDTKAETITPRGELEDQDSRAARIHLWCIPGRFPVGPFADFDAVLAACAHDDWWVARHGVEVIGRMLAGLQTPWVGEDFDHRARFDRVRDQIAERPGAAHRALLTALAHDDPDVRAAALTWLREISGLDHGAGDEGVRAWQAWLEAKGFAR